MRILYLTGQLISHGGIEKILSLKLNYFAEQTKHEVFLSTYEQVNNPFVYELSDKVNYVDLDINYNVDYTKESLYSKRCLRLLPKHIYRTWLLIRKIKPDVIIIPNFGYEYWFLPFIKRQSRIIREFHDSQYLRKKQNRIKLFIDNLIQRLYDAVVVLTPEEVNYFDYKANIKVIPNPIVSSNMQAPLSHKKVLSVGRIDRVKCFEDFILIAKKVIAHCPECCFEVYGTGNEVYIAELKSKVENLDLCAHLKFMGTFHPIQEKMCEASVYVCTSKTESFGLTLVEALDVGVPVVSYDSPHGPRNIISNGIDGYLISLGDISDASEKIISLLEDENKRKKMGQNARENMTRFHINEIVKLWDALFFGR